MTFEAIEKKLKEVGLSFTKPTVERIKNKWYFELRISVDSSTCVNGFIHYVYLDPKYNLKQIGSFFASGSNLNNLVTALFERIKANEVVCRVGNYVDDKVVWEEFRINWNEDEKKFIKNLVDTKNISIFVE